MKKVLLITLSSLVLSSFAFANTNDDGIDTRGAKPGFEEWCKEGIKAEREYCNTLPLFEVGMCRLSVNTKWAVRCN